MEGPSGKTPAMRAISVGLARLESIVSGAEIISEEDVGQLRDITRSMLEEFYYEKIDLEASKAAN